jgi:anti-repressor protein
MGNMILGDSPIRINQEATMSTKEISDLTGKRHDNVMADARKMLGEIGSPEISGGYLDKQNRTQPCLLLSRDETMCLVAGYSTELRFRIVKRWRELEESQKPTIPQTYAAALLEAGRLALELEESQAKLEVAAPKADVYDRIVDKNGLYNATQIAQKFGQSAIWLNKQLEDLDVYNRSVKRGRAFKQWFMDAGYGIMRETVTGHSQPMFFSHGEMWIVKRLAEEGLI